MRRFLVIHLPAFRLERCGYGAADLAALIDEHDHPKGVRPRSRLPGRAARLVALTPAARELGLRIGTTATEARALVPGIELLPWDPAGEDEDREALRSRFEAFSDRVEPLVGPGGHDALVIETTHVVGPRAAGRGVRAALGHPAGGVGQDELALAQRAVAMAGELGHRARGAIADDPLAARAVAEWCAPDDGAVVVPAGEGAAQLAGLPIGALIGADELLGALQAVGVDTVGLWAALDPAAVASRYGAVAARLHRIARGGFGGLVELDLPKEEGAPMARASLAGATTRQELGFVLPGLLVELSERLAARDLAAVRLRVVLHLDAPAESAGSAIRAFTIRVGRATRSPRALEQLVRARLDRFTVEAPIEELVLEVIEVAPESAWQPGLADRTEASEPLPDLLARLGDQLGDGALFSAEAVGVWRPERAWIPREFPRPTLAGGPKRVKIDDPVELQEGREQGFPVPRPTLLLPRPERVEIGCAPDGRPQRVRTAQGWRPVERCAGPERLWGEWWEKPPLDRTYWVVEVDGRALWTWRDPGPTGGWWLHGYFD